MFIDDKISIELSKADAYGVHAKHIDVRFHHAQHQTEMRAISIECSDTEEDTSDTCRAEKKRRKENMQPPLFFSGFREADKR